MMKTSIGLVSEVDPFTGTVKLERLQDWSEGYRRWTPNPDDLVLDLEGALVFDDNSLIQSKDLQPGNTVYLVHDVATGYLVFKIS